MPGTKFRRSAMSPIDSNCATAPPSPASSVCSSANKHWTQRSAKHNRLTRYSGVKKDDGYLLKRLKSIRPSRAYSWDEWVEESSRASDDESGTESDSSRSDYDSEYDTDDEGALQGVYEAAKSTYLSIRSRLMESAWPKVEKWSRCARYVMPPDDRLPPQSRSHTPDARPRPVVFYEQIADPEDPNRIVVTKADGYFHLACPFYVSNPEKHRRCLLKHDLQSIEDVIRHVGRQHMEPPYCPRCRRTFSRATDRDRHFLSQTCQIQNWAKVEGVNSYQKSRMKKRDKIILGEWKRWLRIWDIACPHLGDPPRSHYLSGAEEVKVSFVRDYWSNHGKHIVADFLAESEHDEVITEAKLEVISILALEDILHLLANTSDLLCED